MDKRNAPIEGTADVWNAVRDELRLAFGQGIFDTWLEPLSLVCVANGTVLLLAPNLLVRDYVASHYAARMERAFEAIVSKRVSVEITFSGHSLLKSLPPKIASTASSLVPGAGVSVEPLEVPCDRQIEPAQTFQSFVVGDCNLFAFKAVERMAEEDGSIHLLFIHGKSGFGKTHLLNALALAAQGRKNVPVLFLRAGEFMRRFLIAVGQKDVSGFAEEIEGARLLLIDDLQHIARSAEVGGFLRTLSTFINVQHKIVITADCAPEYLKGLDDELCSRLRGGVVIELQKLDRETRFAILKAKATEIEKRLPRAKIPESVLVHVAEELDVSPRELLGVVTKLATYTDLTGKTVTPEVVEEAIGRGAGGNGGRVTVDEIQKKIAEYYKLDLQEMHSSRRARRFARPRQVAMCLARELTSRSLPDIGRRFGGRDHTTVLHACRRIEKLCKSDPVFKQEIEFLRKVLSRQPRAA